MVAAMPLVAIPMTAADLERIFTDVGLLPVAKTNRKSFDEALAGALAIATASREALNEGEYKRLVDAITASIVADGSAASGQVGMTKALRANALAIELTLLDAAAQAIVPSPDSDVESRLRWAQALRRADAAQETMSASSTIAVGFISVASALPELAALPPDSIQKARATLLSDGPARAEIAEQLSLAVLESGALRSNQTTNQMQVELTTALAKGIAVDPKALEQIALALSSRNVFAPAAKLARLDVMLVQSIIAGFPSATAFEIASSLERAAPSARFISGRMMRVPQFARDALALPTITTEQAKAVSAALAEWQSADLTSYVAILQGDADLMSAAAAFAKSINPQDSQTWQIGGASPTSHRFAQQDAKRLELVNARRGIAKATREKLEVILGPELWKSIAPGVPARISARVSTAAKDLM